MIRCTRRFGTLSVLDTSSYLHFNVHIKRVFERTLDKEKTEMLKTVGVMKKRCRKMLSYKQKKDDVVSGRSDERLEKVRGVDLMSYEMGSRSE